jgi:hypothetical protein
MLAEFVGDLLRDRARGISRALDLNGHDPRILANRAPQRRGGPVANGHGIGTGSRYEVGT